MDVGRVVVLVGDVSVLVAVRVLAGNRRVVRVVVMPVVVAMVS